MEVKNIQQRLDLTDSILVMRFRCSWFHIVNKLSRKERMGVSTVLGCFPKWKNRPSAIALFLAVESMHTVGPHEQRSLFLAKIAANLDRSKMHENKRDIII